MRKIIQCLCSLLLVGGCNTKQSQFVEPEETSRPTIIPLEPNVAFEGEEWYSRYDIFEENRELARASFTAYDSKKKALEAEKTSLDNLGAMSSPYVQSLNGTWTFYFAENPSNRLKKSVGSEALLYEENWDSELKDKIEVPSNIQTSRNEDGTFKYEPPMYINQIYPWLTNEAIQWNWENVPVAPTAVNSVGHYKREFELSESMKDRNIFVSFKGVESAFYLYINGKRVGYSEDSYTTSEFNITPYLKEGRNTIAVEVYRWSTGSYFENQDFIRLSGIFRDVLLLSKDDVEIRDVFVSNSINDDYSEATISIETAIRNLSTDKKSGYSLVVDVIEPNNGQSILSNPITKHINSLEGIGGIKDDGTLLHTEINIKNPKLWSSEKPHLYQVVLELIDNHGVVIEATCIRTGVREVEVKMIEGISQVVVNGKRVMFKGANRHETSLVNGRAITKEEILKDIQLLKSYNFNALRMSHYPNNEYTYELADELGLYIVDEANIESHIGEKELSVPGNNPIYIPLILDRTKNMVERDKNHPSVLIWSLGNESTYKEYPLDDTYPFFVTTQWILNRDPKRLRVYERDNRINDTREYSIVDIQSSQYWTLDQLNTYGKKEKGPFFQSEYGHAMGNALGNFKEYYDTFRKCKNIQGGFIWDFIDQSIWTVDESGNSFYGSGADWETLLHDGDFCGNGVVSANRVPQAEIEEVKKVQQDFLFSLNKDTLVVTNESIDTNLNEFDVVIEYLYDGISTYKQMLDEEILDVLPQQTKEITLQIPSVGAIEEDVYLNIQVMFKEDQLWKNEYGGKRGDVVAKEQFILKKVSNTLELDNNKKVNCIESDTEIKVRGDNFELIFNKEQGVFSKYNVGNEVLIVDGPRPSFFRSPVSNDIEFSESVREGSNAFKQTQLNLKKEETHVVIDVKGRVESMDSMYQATYTIDGNGGILVDSKIEVASVSEIGDVARVGLEMKLSSSIKEYELLGRGPFENYSDRNSASFLGIYNGKLFDEFNETYLTPQDSGNRTDVKYLLLKGDQSSLQIKSDIEMAINILPYTDQDIAKAKHYYELKKLDNPILHIDAIQRGLGNGSWGAEPLEEYQIKQGKTYRFKVLISPK